MKHLCINLKWNKALLFLLSVILAAGCSAQTAAPIAKQERSDSGLKYEVLKAPYAPFIEEALKTQKQKKEATIIEQEGFSYVLITLGQRPSAGYKVVIDEVDDTKNQIIIHYSEEKPDGMAASVITYPSLVLKFPQSNMPIYVQKKN